LTPADGGGGCGGWRIGTGGGTGTTSSRWRRAGVVGLGEQGGHGGVRARLPRLQARDLVQNLLHDIIEGFELLRQRLHQIRHLGLKSSWFPRRQNEEHRDLGEKLGRKALNTNCCGLDMLRRIRLGKG